MNSVDELELPKQILQLQKAHVVFNYKKYCDESNFEGLWRSKLFEILDWQEIFLLFFSKFPEIIEKALEVSILRVYKGSSSIFRTITKS